MEKEDKDKDKIYSKRVRAGKRTYFFDVRSTRSSDYYLTITESRRYQKDDGFVFEKSKMFIYKEDFEKFAEALNETLDHIKTELMPDYDFTQFNRPQGEYIAENASTEVVETAEVAESNDDHLNGSIATELKWE